MDQASRRSVLKVGAAGLLISSAPVMAQPVADDRPPVFAGMHTPKPLTFDPAKLEGLSERLITSHWQNNYIGSVNALNMIEGRLAKAMEDPDVHQLVYAGLKREELHRTGSVILHEVYFDALGGDGEPGGNIKSALAAAWGSFETWQQEFIHTARALGGGSGWVMLSFNLHTKSLHTYWAPDHMHNATLGVPLLALDMYEHSYHMDYGTAAMKYVDAFFKNIDWQVVDRRYHRARRMAAV
ncbi:MAG: superoxide dismutase [Rhodospirillaceae bacterium]|jgi:superoxide dismutase, Fe-Mn family|nr:superoxide dismutase [Rhodospirillaceae bacterium]MBT5565428.1 superoxide dismutase [Rhodospirillaceae bacterium]MBT6089256.1 superoxide dismutase [Rhodospirillaceae bacterium]MBT7451206.1 superoxide dismutase [Rhodospirillaceae bacterium]